MAFPSKGDRLWRISNTVAPRSRTWTLHHTVIDFDGFGSRRGRFVTNRVVVLERTSDPARPQPAEGRGAERTKAARAPRRWPPPPKESKKKAVGEVGRR
jgi:hypothetical protein